MDPVFGGRADEVLLGTACGAVALDGVAAGPDLVVKAGKFNNQGIIIVFEERFGLQTSCKDRLQVPIGLLIVLLDDLLEACVVELGELGEIMDVGNDITQVLLQEHEFFLARIFQRSIVEATEYIIHLAFSLMYALDGLS